LARVHLIAEPWDAGYDGYQLGRFPGRFLEWNDKFRDAVRGYWLRSGVARGELARRFTASSDLFHHGQRRPTASVNFVSVHDGFTLADVVSYSKKHNHANGEDNRDGRDNELCNNFGVEGPTANAAIAAARRRVRRALIATLLLAQGTPMLCAGDEIGNSQQGNNNAYCQDNPVTRLNWESAEEDFRSFVAEVIALRRSHPLLHRDRWFDSHGGPSEASLAWYAPGGHEMQMHDWHDHGNHAFGLRLESKGSMVPAEQLMILFNPETQPQAFVLPAMPWQLLLDSSADVQLSVAPLAGTLTLPPQALLVLRARADAHRDEGKHA
jgi:glycogen operon protein